MSSSSILVGAASTLEEIRAMLMSEECRIMAVSGMGGVGKTTLVRQTFNRLLDIHHFDVAVWVTVSQNLSVEKLQDDIWKSLGVFDSNWVDKSFNEKSEALAHFLSDKKFLLVLDDVWKAFQLSDIGVPCVEQGATIRDFKVILTSRSEYVCHRLGAQAVFNVETLSLDSAWHLFREKLGRRELDDEGIRPLVQRIVQQCRGLPLPLCTVARAMASRTTYEEWLDASNKLSDSERPGDIFYLLEFCFDSLPSDITTSCIFYFSLFPEDYSIPKNELIDFWICEHLLGHEQDVLNLGYDTLHALIGASLLEDEGDYVKLQDVLRDCSLSLVFRTQMLKNAQLIYGAMDNGALPNVGWIVSMKESVENTASIPHKLSTFLLNHNPFIAIKGEISQFMDALTVLVLSNCGVEALPREVSNLASLQYLDLSHTWIDCLPIELKKLTKLKCLNLEHDRQLRVIPKQLMYSLSSLQVLKMFRCGFSIEELGDNILSVRNMDIDPILCLKYLQVISITITCSSALEKLFRSPELIICTQSLSLEVFWGSETLDISPLAAMKNLLTLEIHLAETLQKLSFDAHYRELLKERSFERLQEVTVENCSSLQELTWVVLAQNLVTLRVKGCEQMKEIISTAELGDVSLEPFAKLEILELEDLPELKSICLKALSLRSLDRITIVDCSLLRELPLNPNKTNTYGIVIEAEEDWWGNVEWEDDATRTTFLPFFRPLNLDS